MTDDDLKKLWHYFHDIEDAKLSVYASNSFVCACYLHESGQEKAACKMLSTLFNFIGRYRRKTLIQKVFAFLPGNEKTLAHAVAANIEVKRIFD